MFVGTRADSRSKRKLFLFREVRESRSEDVLWDTVGTLKADWCRSVPVVSNCAAGETLDG